MSGSETNVRHMRAIGELCRQAGLRVLEAGGWTTRGRDWAELRPEYVVCHHTASPVDIDRLLIEGRSDLPGPLCSFALHADGTVVLIASGTANHAGVATISSAQAWGIEATGPIPTGNTGPDAFPQFQAYVTLCAAICVHHRWPASRVVGHKEIARPDGRKIDPAFGSSAPAPYDDMRRFRAQVDQRVRNWGQEADMPLDQNDKDWFVARLEESERRVARYVDHGDAAVTGSGNHHVKVREDLAAVQADVAQLAAQVREVKAAVDAIVLGKVTLDLDITGALHGESPPPPVVDVPLPG